MIQPVKIICSRRKTLSVSVDVFGQVIVRAPLRCGDERIFSFLREKEAWISKYRQKALGAGIKLPPENLDGYRFLLLGKECAVRLYTGSRIRYDEKTGEVFLPAENSRAKLTDWLKRNAKRIFSAVCSRRAAEMGTHYPSLSVTKAKTRWGSCSYNDALHFSFRLLYAPMAVIDYVIVHELSHTFYKNHGEKFWALVERYVPDYRKKRAWLKENSFLMEIF